MSVKKQLQCEWVGRTSLCVNEWEETVTMWMSENKQLQCEWVEKNVTVWMS